MSRYSDRMCNDYCKPTCPAVDAVFDRMLKRMADEAMVALAEVKDEGTEKLRAALSEACDRIEELEGQVADLEAELKRAQESA